MDISGVSFPVPHEVPQQPPRDAQLQNAVREPEPTEQQGNDTRPDADADDRQSRASSGLGQHVDVRA